jgi:hypothetical protein
VQGAHSASPEQITWSLASYIVATAVTTPISGRLNAGAASACCIDGLTDHVGSSAARPETRCRITTA